MIRFALLLPIALLAACKEGGANSSSFKIDTGGFKADVDIPSFVDLGEDMDIDGVKMYPGTKVSGVAIDAKRDKDHRFSTQFTAPADRAKVGEWYAGQFKDHGFTARATPTGFAGTTSEGKWFTLDLAAAGAQTQGEFKLGKQR